MPTDVYRRCLIAVLPLLSTRSLIALCALLSLAGCQLALEHRTPDDADLELDDVWERYASPLTEEELFEEVLEGTFPAGAEPTGVDVGSMPSADPLLGGGMTEGGTMEVLDLPDVIPPDPLAGIPPPLADSSGVARRAPAPVMAQPTPSPVRVVGPSRIGGGVPPPPPPPQWDPSLDRRVNANERLLPAGTPTTVTGPGATTPGATIPFEGDPFGGAAPAAPMGAEPGLLEPTAADLANLDPSGLPGPGEPAPLPGRSGPDVPAPSETADPLCPPTGNLPSPLPNPRDVQPRQPATVPAPTPIPDPMPHILPHHPVDRGDGPIDPWEGTEELPIGSVRQDQPEPVQPPAPESAPAESSQDLGAPPTGDLPAPGAPAPRAPAPPSPADMPGTPSEPVVPRAPAPPAGTEEDPWATPSPAIPSQGEPAPAAPARGTEEDPWASPAPAQPAGTEPAPAPAAPSGVDDDPWGSQSPSAPAGTTPAASGSTRFVSDTREGKALEQVTRLLDAPGDPQVKGYPDEVVPKAEAWVALRAGPRPLVIVFHDDSLRTSDRMAAEILPVLARYGPRVDVVTVDRNPAATRNEYEQQAVERFLGDSDDVPVTIVTDEERKRLLVKFGWFPAEELEAVLRDAMGEGVPVPSAADPRSDPLLNPPTGDLPSPPATDTMDPLDPLPAPGRQLPAVMPDPAQPSTPRDEYRFTAPQAAQAAAHADRLRASPTDRRIGGYPKSLVRRANPRMALEPGHRPVVILFHDDTSRASNLQAADLLPAIVEAQDGADFVVIDVSPGATRTPDEQKVYKPYYPGIVPSTIVLSPARGPVKLWFQRTSAKSLRAALREATTRR